MISAPEKSDDPTVWVDEYGNYLYAYAYLRVRDEGIAENLLQETLLSAIQSFENYQGQSSQRRWLTHLLKEKIIKYFRHTHHEAEITPAEADFSSYQYLFDDQTWNDHWTPEMIPNEWDISPEAAFEEGEFCEVLKRCLGELPERIANAYTLRELEGQNPAETCEILGISKEIYWLMLHRARTHLRRCLEFDWFRKREVQ